MGVSIRIFVSSPGDVAEERALAERVIERLQREWAHAATIDSFLWEHEPLRATAGYQDEIDRLCRPSDSDIVVCLLWCRFGSRLPANMTRPDGRPYASGTEYELEDAVAGYERTGIRPALLLYKKTARLLVDIDDPRYAERRRQKDELEAFLRDWAGHPDGTAKRAMHHFETSSDFEDLLERHLHRLMAQHADRAGQKARVAPSWRESPFRGLAVFEPQHAPIFFGRTAATSAIVAAVRERDARGEAFVAVVGASGSGKSSLVRAGVLSLMTSPGVMRRAGLWRRAIFVPGERDADLFRGLAAAVTDGEGLPELIAGGRSVGDLAATFREHPASFGVAVEGGLRQAAALLQRDRAVAELPGARLALVVDQMEQLFTLEGVTAEDRTRFVACLASAVKARAAVVIATLRSDFFERCHTVPELLALMQGDGQYQLQSPGPAELERIITRPAALAGLDFEPGTETRLPLDQRLRDAALENPHSLPLLEFALEQLYERRTAEGRLTHAAYDEIGELQGAVANHAEQAFLAWSRSGSAPSSRPGGADQADAVLGVLFRTLVTIQADSEQVTARRFTESELPDGAPRDLANALLAARLVVKDTDRTGRPVFAAAHEAVLREWPRAREWLARNLEFLRARARITADQARWESSSPSRIDRRDPGFLLPAEGRRLAEAEELLRKHRAELEPATIEFINASVRRATAGALRRRSGYAALLVLLVGTAFGVYALLQSRQIDRQRRLAVAYRLASQAELERAQQPGLSALLAAESLVRQPGVEADVALRRSLAILPELVFEREIGQVEALSSAPGTFLVEHDQRQGLRTFNPETNARSRWLLGDVAGALALSGTHVAADGGRVVNLTQNSGRGNHLRIVQTATGTVTDVPFDGYFARSALSPDGRWVAAVSDSQVLTWDLAASPPRAYGRPMRWQGGPGRVLFSPDARRLAVTAGFSVYVFDPTLGEPRIITRPGFASAVAFRPNGDEIAIAGRQDACLFTLATPAAPACIPQDQPANDIAFDASGSRLAIAGDSGVLRVVDVATRVQAARLSHDDKVSSVMWNRAGTMVAARTEKGIVRVWNIDAEREVARLSDESRVLWFGDALTTISNASRVRSWSMQEGLTEHRLLSHPQAVHDVAFSPDGRSIVTGSGYAGEEGTRTPDYNVRVWPIDRGVAPVVLPQDQAVGVVRLVQDGKYLVTAGWWHMSVWDLSQQREVATIPCRSEYDDLEMARLAFGLSRDGRRLACHTNAASVQVFNVADGQPVGPGHRGEDPVLGVTLNDDGSRLAMTRGQTLEIKEVATGADVARVPTEAEAGVMAFIPGSDRMPVVSSAGVRIFDAKRGAWDAVKLDGPITALPVVGPDGRLMVLVNEATASIRDLTSGEEVARLVHPEGVGSVALSGDGRFLATTARDNVARVWDVAARRERVRLAEVPSASPLSGIAFSADGTLFATTHGREVRLWILDTERLRAQACGRVRGNLTAAEWAEYVGAGDACTATCRAFPACAGVPAEGAPPPRLLK